MSAPALVATGLSVERSGRLVVRDVDLELWRGEIVVLLGPNGAGKTTLLSALAGLLARAEGEVMSDGRVAAALQAPALARRSALANVEAGLAWWGVPRGERRGRAENALELFGVAALANRAARSLSGGEARRVHLARTLAVEPDVLLLDEPFAGLDPAARADLLYDSATVLRSPRRATLVIVHDRAEAWALADRVVVMTGGRVRIAGAPADALERPPSADVAEFLGFSGRIEEDGCMRLMRPSHVILDPDGDLRGIVTRRIPLEDGVRVEVEVPGGRIVTVAPIPGPEPGQPVRLRVTGGVAFPIERTAAWTTT